MNGSIYPSVDLSRACASLPSLCLSLSLSLPFLLLLLSLSLSLPSVPKHNVGSLSARGLCPRQWAAEAALPNPQTPFWPRANELPREHKHQAAMVTERSKGYARNSIGNSGREVAHHQCQLWSFPATWRSLCCMFPLGESVRVFKVVGAACKLQC